MTDALYSQTSNESWTDCYQAGIETLLLSKALTLKLKPQSVDIIQLFLRLIVQRASQSV